MSWGNDASNSRFAPQGGVTAADLPRLKLKWAFGFEGITSARVQPAMAGGKLFVASDNAELNALDPKTGCAYWTFKAEFGVRSALAVGQYRSAGQVGYAVFFGDQRANAYAVDANTGRLIWKRKVDEYPSAAITGAPTIQDGKVFVPVQGLQEEGSGGRGQTPCCRFRGKPYRAQRRYRRHHLEDVHGGRTEASRNEHPIGTGSVRAGRRRHLVLAHCRHETPHCFCLDRKCLRRSTPALHRCDCRDGYRHGKSEVVVSGNHK